MRKEKKERKRRTNNGEFTCECSKSKVSYDVAHLFPLAFPNAQMFPALPSSTGLKL